MQRTANLTQGSLSVRFPEDFGTAGAYGIHEIDATLIRATNYTDDGYPIKMRINVIRSNTLTQMAALTRDIVQYRFLEM
jgi:hypothetical protein